MVLADDKFLLLANRKRPNGLKTRLKRAVSPPLPPSPPPHQVASRLRKSLTVSGVCGGATRFFFLPLSF